MMEMAEREAYEREAHHAMQHRHSMQARQQEHARQQEYAMQQQRDPRPPRFHSPDHGGYR